MVWILKPVATHGHDPSYGKNKKNVGRVYIYTYIWIYAVDASLGVALCFLRVSLS
jgi:hypothetical protein